MIEAESLVVYEFVKSIYYSLHRGNTVFAWPCNLHPVLSDGSRKIRVVVYFAELGEHKVAFRFLHEEFAFQEFLMAVSPKALNKVH